MAFTNNDKILQSVLLDSKFMEISQYTPTGQETIDDIIYSDDANIYVQTVAKIIDGKKSNKTDKQIYDEINNFLFNKI